MNNLTTPQTLEKGLGRLSAPLAEAAQNTGWNLLREDLLMPAAVLYESRLANNLAWMQRFTEAYGLKLAPHGKTTMTPALFRRQLDAGAWGITLATAHQTAVAAAHGVKRVLLANQLVGRRNIELVAELVAGGGFEFYCLVDSPEGVEQLGRRFAERGQVVSVLLEIGVQGGRTGVRDEAQQNEVLDAIERHQKAVSLAGVEFYEGVLEGEDAIRAFVRRAVDVTADLAKSGRLRRSPAIVSGAGSAWYDLVAEGFAEAKLDVPVEFVLRPGCYLTHDAGIYRAAQARIQSSNSVAQKMQTGLVPALELWAYVQSRPEPGRGILALGKRDAAFDAGLPLPIRVFRPGRDTTPQPTPPGWKLSKIMDQHAFLDVAHDDDLSVGDLLAFDISHPCLTFDKWRTIPVVNDEYDVVDVVRTYF
jgi:D-serine dehydratase